MFKYAVIFLIILLVAGALGLTNISAIAKRISLGQQSDSQWMDCGKVNGQASRSLRQGWC